MFISFLIFVISIALRVLFSRLSLTWDWLSPMAVISKYVLIVCAVLFIIMSVITIVKAIKK